MPDIFVPITGGSFTASPGVNFIIPDGMTGNLFIDGATNFTVSIENNLTGSGGDNLNIVTQSGNAGLIQIGGGNPNGSDTDLVRVGVRPDQQAAFDGFGSYSSPGPAFNSSPALQTAAVIEVNA